ncbi:RluA family pseudouridine synthase [Sphingosinicella soli]|uniref:Pseudouridine synthase n=1 Tax=Sphingosinicella soli TaxID=333708 RepID=A0A7W7B468_9SPHN|nr:RluA family pseudouridine synthase [Sphingosinicella soli]MBB4632612.1 23S rRNA pseudouridine955/2504/2580 synthase [Sphingosinicella soli]
MSANESDGVRQFTVGEDDDGIRLDRWFKRHLPDTSFTTVAKWARTGQLRVGGKRAQPGDRIESGQIIRVPPADASAPTIMSVKKAERPTLSDDQIEFAQSLVIYRDDYAIVLNKPAGLATQGGTKLTAHVDGLLDALMFERADRPKLVHRLDKDTSGVLLIARSSRAAAHFSRAFAGRTAKKLYWAIVMRVPEIRDGVIELPISKQPGTGGEKMYVDEASGQRAVTRYRRIERAASRTAWLEMQPLTGRTHQLRVHAAAIGHPIVGDVKYGGKDAVLAGSISRKLHLHARRLVIELPDGKTLDIKAEPAPHFAETLATIGFDASIGDLPLEEELVDPGAEDRRAKHKARDARRERRDSHRSRRGSGRVAPTRSKK